MGLQRRISTIAVSTVALAGGVPCAAAPALAAPPEAPEVTVEAPVKANEATVHGILNPAKVGEAGEYQFLYKASGTKECKGGSVTPTTPGAAAGGLHEEVSAGISGLTPNTEYAVCLRAENAKGEGTVSPAVSFSTAEATAPIVESQSSESKKGTITVLATINPGGAETTCEVQYGKTEALEATPVPCPTKLPAGDTGQTVAVELKGLEPKTEYHFKFVAGNAKGTTGAAQATFKTGPYPPSFVITFGPSEVKRARATLGEVSPGPGGGLVVPSEEEKTVYYFEYGTEACSLVKETCGVKTPTSGPVTGFTLAEPVKVTRLKPGTTYHYWLAASGPGGTAHGEEMTFTTAVAEPKEYVFDKNIEVGSPVGVGINQATGDLYVSNSSTKTIEQFNAAGVLQSSTKTPAGISEPIIQQLAVDNSGLPGQQGDVYLAVYPNKETGGVVYKFDPDPAGKLTLDQATPEIGKGALKEPFAVAVAPDGNVYVVSHGTGTVVEFSPTGKLENASLISGLGDPRALAIDGSGNIYVAGSSGTVEYTSAGVCINACTPIDASFGVGVTLDPGGNVFVSVLAPPTVHEYGPVAGHPPIQNPVLEREGTFNGFPRGLAVNGSSHTLYVAENEGSIRVFRFLDVKPVVVKTDQATQVGGLVEALNGTVNPGGQEPAEYYFEYGLAPCAAETCGTVATEPSQVPLNGDEAIPVSVRLDSLAPNTTYHYRIVGVNEESGVEYGEERTFTTGSTTSTPAVRRGNTPAPESQTPASLPVYPLLTTIAPVPGPKPPPIPKTLTRAQRLAKALAACNRKPRRQRAACKRQARRKYGTVVRKKGSAKGRRK